MNKENLIEKEKELIADVKVGLRDLGIPTDEALEKLDEFYNFIEEISEKYGVEDFFCNIGKKGLSFRYNFNFEDKKYKYDMGIILEKKIIPKEDIKEKLEIELRLAKIKNILDSLDSLEYQFRIQIDNEKEIWTKFKDLVNRTDDKVIFKRTYMGNLSSFLKEFFDYELKEKTKGENKILKVFEKENLRIAVALKESSYESDYHYLIMATPKCEIYNYLDEGRFVLFEGNCMAIFDFDNEQEDLEFLDSAMIGREFNGKSVGYIDKDRLSKLIISKKNKEKLEELKQTQEKEIEDSVSKAFEKDGKITLNSITRFRDGYFEYQGQKIGFNGFNVFYINKEEKDFNEIFGRIANHYWGGNYQGKKLFCGGFSIKLEKKPDKSGESDRFYIDGIRINKGEVVEVLNKALCYQKKKDYLEFLREVSRCSIKIHNVLSEGLIYNLGDRSEGDILCKIILERKKNRHFIKFNDNLHQIRNINNLIEIQNWTYNHLNTHILADRMNKNANMTYDLAIETIKDGLKYYKESLERAKQLLQDTIKSLKVKETEINNNKEFEGKGYLVKGKSGKEYFIGEDLKVYEYPNMRYICIIDKSRTNLNKIDLLISRILALANDKVMIEDNLINTLH